MKEMLVGRWNMSKLVRQFVISRWQDCAYVWDAFFLTRAQSAGLAKFDFMGNILSSESSEEKIDYPEKL